ncbi:MAG: bifunctional N(6)-L-threonylcarbamoyladenine synthase/serine/threonine protein kinase [Nanoarchaeota archaeon]
MSIILGIESTAHTFGCAVVNSRQVLSNIKDSYTTEKGGIIPTNAAEHHKKIKYEIYERALKEANISEKQITAIAFSQGPGLSPCLHQGANLAKHLALKLNIPIVPVNHCIAHQEIGEITGAKDPVLLYASGANTQIIAFAGKRYRIFGETLDIGVGNFIDTYARHTGLGFPGGPKIQVLANLGKNYIEIPYVVKGMDISLSGILTNLKQKYDSKKYKEEDLAFSLQETVFAMLVEVSERALAHTGKKELVLGGGVACNTRLQEMCKIMCENRNCKFFVPENQFLIDNAGMIAYLGEKMFLTGKYNIAGKKDIENLEIKPRQRTDEVEVLWR